MRHGKSHSNALYMSVHVSETRIDNEGRVVLDHLPFKPGEKVEVTIRSQDDVPPSINLLGSVLRYDDPFEPVAAEEWEAGR